MMEVAISNPALFIQALMQGKLNVTGKEISDFFPSLFLEELLLTV